ncbi:PA3496 family putative envelope integrity protein [Legionella sp. km772]|uniref:PA3496 family putative envelope integrity protein n=1 Tax=Legionella sp. km772 TaxID=2498111 RepID=UPI000F8C80C0|nr:hypothetical protein [Legionella sp. km772]RUR12425.1 hypothetical protein ELY15_05215 [Legionella sp. km772]
MSDLFEDDETEVLATEEEFEDIEVETEGVEGGNNLDARRRLENILEEKRLQDELDDFVDY